MYAGKTPLDMQHPPSTDELLALRTNHPAAPLATIKQHPHGMSFEHLPPLIVQPARAEADAHFEVMANDVAAELAVVERQIDRPYGISAEYPLLLAARRMPHVYNSVTRASAATDPYRWRTPTIEIDDLPPHHASVVSAYSPSLGETSGITVHGTAPSLRWPTTFACG